MMMRNNKNNNETENIGHGKINKIAAEGFPFAQHTTNKPIIAFITWCFLAFFYGVVV